MQIEAILNHIYKGLSSRMCRGHRRILPRRWCRSWQRQTNCSILSRALEDRRAENFMDFCVKWSTLWRQARSSWCWSRTHSSLARGNFPLFLFLLYLSFSLPLALIQITVRSSSCNHSVNATRQRLYVWIPKSTIRVKHFLSPSYERRRSIMCNLLNTSTYSLISSFTVSAAPGGETLMHTCILQNGIKDVNDCNASTNI